MTRANEIRKEIKQVRKQLGDNMRFIKNELTNRLFLRLAELNLRLNVEIERENEKLTEKLYPPEKSFDADAAEIDEAQRYRDIRETQERQ